MKVDSHWTCVCSLVGSASCLLAQIIILEAADMEARGPFLRLTGTNYNFGSSRYGSSGAISEAFRRAPRHL
eukprot:gene5628-biopygen2313